MAENMVARDGELRRKGIHLIGLTVPTLYMFADKLVVLSFIAFWAIIFIAFEIYRFRRGIPKKAMEVAKPLMRKYERRGVAAHVFLSLGLFLAVLLYAKDIAIATSLIIVLADGAAAVVGRYLGGHRLVCRKTLEGTLTLIAVAFVVSVWIVGAALAFTGAVVAGAVELLPINDNISIPFFSGLAMTAMRYFL